ncbi:unnamed protein product [Discula destructiva]
MQFNILLSVAAVLLAGEALGANVNYVMSYNGKDLKGNAAVVKEKKAGGSIADDKADDLVKSMGTWSGGKYEASQHAATKIITVINAKSKGALASKSAASDAVSDAQQIVNKNIK